MNNAATGHIKDTVQVSSAISLQAEKPGDGGEEKRREEGVAQEVINQGDSLHPGIPTAGKPTHILQGWDKAKFLYEPLTTPSFTSHYLEVVTKTLNVVMGDFF